MIGWVIGGLAAGLLAVAMRNKEPKLYHLETDGVYRVTAKTENPVLLQTALAGIGGRDFETRGSRLLFTMVSGTDLVVTVPGPFPGTGATILDIEEL